MCLISQSSLSEKGHIHSKKLAALNWLGKIHIQDQLFQNRLSFQMLLILK